MSQTLEATFDGQVFRPVETVELQPDTQVELVVTVKAASEEKPKSFSSHGSFFETEGSEELVITH